MQVIRRTYERVVNEYILDVDQGYCDELAKYVNSRIVDESQYIALTINDIKAIVNGDWDKWNTEITFKYTFYSDEDVNEVKTYNEMLGDFIWESIDQDLWDSDYECIEGETDDYDTFIED